MKIQPIILAGGTGTRLWPLSRALYPKQVLNLFGEQSLLQTTLLRVDDLENTLPPLLVVGEEHRFLAAAQVEALDRFATYTLLLEPVGRNTAAAIAGAVLYAQRLLAGEDEEVVLLVLPADHLIAKPDHFQVAIKEACPLASAGQIVTFGVVPTGAETGYGYIAKGEGNAIAAFVEKPDVATAEQYVAAGTYFWNSGMFLFTVAGMTAELAAHAPGVLTHMGDAVEQGTRDGHFYRFDAAAMEKSPDDSIDYAVMEKTGKGVVVPVDLGWSDIGSWQALWEAGDKDVAGNVVSGDVILRDVENSLVRSEDTLVAAVGLKDTMVVKTADAVLVAPIARSQDVKTIVNELKAQGREEFQVHRTASRPWGSYTVLEIKDRYQIKRITVLAGRKLSLQMHHHRNEHWIVVTGTALVTKGEENFLLHANQSVYIPAGLQHRLENPGMIDLELIEVQQGDYLGEDDIIRFDDEYGREESS